MSDQQPATEADLTQAINAVEARLIETSRRNRRRLRELERRVYGKTS
jgi:hypothetical protein